MPIEISLIQTQVTNASTKAERQIKKLPKIVIKPEKIAEKNKAILENLNDYIHEVDKFYLEKRAAILQKKAEQMGVFIPDDVIALIANSSQSNIREMEGLLKKVEAYF